MLQMFALGEMPDAEPDQVAILQSMPEDFEARSGLRNGFVVPGETEYAEPEAAVPLSDYPELNEQVFVAPVAEAAPQVQAESQQPAPFAEPVYPQLDEELSDPALLIRDEIDADLLPVFIEEGRDMLPQMGQALRAWQQDLGNTLLPQSLSRLLHTVKGSARMAGAMSLGQHMHEMETRIENITHAGHPSNAALEDLLAR